MLKIGVQQLIAEANSQVVSREVDEVMRLHSEGEVLMVDVRDLEELRNTGTIAGAVHASRGVLEMSVDPSTPRYNPVFGEGKELVLY